MKASQITNLLLLLLALFLSAMPALAQNPKQELNDQLFEAARKGDAAAVTGVISQD